MTINKVIPVFCLRILIFIYRKYLLVIHFVIKCIVMFSIEQSVLFTILPLQEYIEWIKHSRIFDYKWDAFCILMIFKLTSQIIFASKLLSVHYFLPSTCCKVMGQRWDSKRTVSYGYFWSIKYKNCFWFIEVEFLYFVSKCWDHFVIR